MGARLGSLPVREESTAPPPSASAAGSKVFQGTPPLPPLLLALCLLGPGKTSYPCSSAEEVYPESNPSCSAEVLYPESAEESYPESVEEFYPESVEEFYPESAEEFHSERRRWAGANSRIPPTT